MTTTEFAAVDGMKEVSATPPARTQPFCWSVKREIWENRSIYIVPAIAAVLILTGFLISIVKVPQFGEVTGMGQGTMGNHPVTQRTMMQAHPFAHAWMLLMAVAFVVAFFYSLDALYGERRDRSILFWKSLPVSDLTVVLSKFVVPVAILPAIVFVLSVVLQWVMYIFGTAEFRAIGVHNPFSPVPMFQIQAVQLYTVIVIALWYTPIVAFLLMISAWAKRMPILWALLPIAAIQIFEAIAFGTHHFGELLQNRFGGFAERAYNLMLPDGNTVDPHMIPLSALTPGRFLVSPGLWLGFVAAALFLYAAIRLRHSRDII